MRHRDGSSVCGEPTRRLPGQPLPLVVVVDGQNDRHDHQRDDQQGDLGSSVELLYGVDQPLEVDIVRSVGSVPSPDHGPVA